MAQNIIIRWRGHFLLCVGVLCFEELLIMAAFCPNIWIVLLFLIYIRVAILLKLTEFHSEKLSRLIIQHFGLSLVAAVGIYFIRKSFQQVIIVFALMNAIYMIWLFAADKWIHWRIAASSTILIDETGAAYKWAECHKEIYQIVENYTEEDIENIEKDITVFKIPLILTEKEPSNSLIILARRLGVMVHYVSENNRPNNVQMTEIHRYKGLYIYTPEPW